MERTSPAVALGVSREIESTPGLCRRSKLFGDVVGNRQGRALDLIGDVAFLKERLVLRELKRFEWSR
jgi:hypothetical protein